MPAALLELEAQAVELVKSFSLSLFVAPLSTRLVSSSSRESGCQCEGMCTQTHTHRHTHKHTTKSQINHGTLLHILLREYDIVLYYVHSAATRQLRHDRSCGKSTVLLHSCLSVSRSRAVAASVCSSHFLLKRCRSPQKIHSQSGPSRPARPDFSSSVVHFLNKPVIEGFERRKGRAESEKQLPTKTMQLMDSFM